MVKIYLLAIHWEFAFLFWKLIWSSKNCLFFDNVSTHLAPFHVWQWWGSKVLEKKRNVLEKKRKEHAQNCKYGVRNSIMHLPHSEVEVPSPSTSECYCVCRLWHYRCDWVKMRPLEWAFIQCDWCLRRDQGHTETPGMCVHKQSPSKDIARNRLSASQGVLQSNQTCLPLHLNI